MEFKINPLREMRAHEFKHKPEYFADGYGTGGSLASYFRVEPTRPQNPSELADPEQWPWFCRFGDGRYRTGDGTPDLGIEEQCETADLLGELCWSYHLDEDKRAESVFEQTRGDPSAYAVLHDIMQEHEVPDLYAMLRAARKVVCYASWLSSWYFYHAQSIEGDYEIFDACEADWLSQQGDVPRDWTRMGLLTLLRAVDRENNYFPTPEDTETWPPVSRRDGAPPCPLPTEDEWALATKLVEQVDLDDNMGPTLIDYFC